MNRSVISTGSRSVTPTPGLSSMRTAISHGPSSVSARANISSNISSSAAHALCARPAPRAMVTRSVPNAVAVGCPPVIW